MRSECAGLLAVLALLSLGGPAAGAVFHSRAEALALAFPDAERVESATYVLTGEQVARVEELARCRVESRIVKIYTGVRDGEVLGHALIDVHAVRTLPEALMVVLTPEGRVRTLRVLAFHEPLEYRPTRRWYRQFGGASLEEPLRLGGDVHGVVGATLSARAVTRSVRRALALYRVLVRKGR